MNKQLAITNLSSNISEAAKIIKSKIPTPRANEILIKNKWVGINAIYDRELYKGNVPYINVSFPYVMGVEAVGEVIDVGEDIDKIKIGDAVSTVKVGTAYQEYNVISEDVAIRIPEASPEHLAINPTGISAALAIEKSGEVQQGETVVVHVVAICGSDKKVDLLEGLQCCDRIINYRKESIGEVLTQEYHNKIDVAFDSVGRHMFDAFLAQLAPLGRLVESIYWKGASVRCFMNHLYKDSHPSARDFLNQAYQKASIKVKIDPTEFNGIESIISASNYLLDGKSLGKVVVKL